MQQHQHLLTPCEYCAEQTLRVKEKKDWMIGEKNGRGYFPELFFYYYCTNCKRTWIRYKHAEELT